MHGGIVDNCILNGAEDQISSFAAAVRDLELPVGIAGHLPQDFVWAEKNLTLDFYMACYYDPSPRKQSPHHDEKAAETYLESDREARVSTIKQLSKPVIHYKIFAAGRNDPEQGFRLHSLTNARRRRGVHRGVHQGRSADAQRRCGAVLEVSHPMKIGFAGIELPEGKTKYKDERLEAPGGQRQSKEGLPLFRGIHPRRVYSV